MCSIILNDVRSSVFCRDMAPEGSTLEESNRNLDELTDLALQLQSQTGIKVLWVTCNLFAHQRSLFYSEKQTVEQTRRLFLI